MNNTPEFPEFHDISWENKSILDCFLSRFPPEISEYTFTNLFVWRKARPIKISLLDQALCIMAQKDEGIKYFLPPLGAKNIYDTAEKMFFYAIENRLEPEIHRVPEDMAINLQQAGFSAEYDINNSDYVYLVDELATLNGRKFDGKRNRIKKCIAEYNPEYRTITPDIVDMCLDLQTEWCNIRHCNMDSGLSSEDIAIRELFSNMEKLPVFGCAIIIDGNIEAFTLAERLNKKTAVIHFEKANPSFDGLYQLINQWFCERELKGKFIYVNREQDLGIEGLRKAKESYYPHFMVKKYIVRKN